MPIWIFPLREMIFLNLFLKIILSIKVGMEDFFQEGRPTVLILGVTTECKGVFHSWSVFPSTNLDPLSSIFPPLE